MDTLLERAAAVVVLFGFFRAFLRPQFGADTHIGLVFASGVGLIAVGMALLWSAFRLEGQHLEVVTNGALVLVVALCVWLYIGAKRWEQ